LGAAVVEEVNFGDEGEVVVAVRPRWHQLDRCGICRRRCPGFDLGEGRRRWRALDLGTTLAYVEADAPRVRGREHGVVVCAVPWARHGSRFTRAFEDQAAWLAVQCSKKATAELWRIAWRTVGSICERVAAEAGSRRDLLAGLSWIGIDEIRHRKGQRYLTVVVCHHTGRLVWAASGRDRRTVEAFLDALGPERCARLELVSADMAAWISTPLAERCPHAALRGSLPRGAIGDRRARWIRRQVWNEARRAGQAAVARELKGARFALWKNPENLTRRQRAKLSAIQQTNRRLYRAYLLKEQLREVYRVPTEHAGALLDAWLAWARRSRLEPFVRLARTIAQQRPGIQAAIDHGLSNARVEAINTKIRLITRRAFGFHTPDALIALAMLTLGGLCPPLPGRLT
jgi:transposase